MLKLLLTILGGVNFLLETVKYSIMIYEFLFSKVEPQVNAIYQWTYDTLKNLEALIKALNELDKIKVELNKEPAPEVETRADRWMEALKEEAEEYNKEMTRIRLKNEETNHEILESRKEHIFKPAVEGVKEGFNFIKEKIGNLFRGGEREPNPYYQPQFYGEYKDYRDVPGMAGTTKLPPGLMGTKMTPEAYADLIVAAVPDAVKRAQEAKAKTPAEKKPKEAGPSDTQEILAALQKMMNSLPAATAAAIPGAVQGALAATSPIRHLF